MRITVSKLTGKVIGASSGTDISIMDQIGPDELFWADVEGFTPDFLNYIEKRFSIDPLTVEDINAGKQRVKIEDYPGYTFMVSKNGFSTHHLQTILYAIMETALSNAFSYLT